MSLSIQPAGNLGTLSSAVAIATLFFVLFYYNKIMTIFTRLKYSLIKMIEKMFILLHFPILMKLRILAYIEPSW